MATDNKDFLRFSAYSIKDLITRKLSLDSKYTDQVYEGSNLAILIDIFSYIGQSLLYSLNTAAAESMWSDTLLYENINRLAKFLSYNPKGVITANAEFVFDNSDADNNILYEGQIILPYSMVATDKIDANGNRVYYSTIDSFYINNDITQHLIMYNGKWKQYNTIFVSTGDKYLTFVLDGLQSDYDNYKFVVNKCVHVYVRHYDTVLNLYTMLKYTPVDSGLFIDNDSSNGINIYSFSDRVYDLRLNENKTYEIMFGNGVNGMIPDKDDLIYIFYLEGNGDSAEITPYEIVNKEIKCSAEDLGISLEIFNEIYADYKDKYSTIYDHEKGIVLTNITKSSAPMPEETVNQIRMNAPNWFKIGNRLVTTSDWEYYIKNAFTENIIDVKCQNNYEYTSTFYKWLYDLGLLNHRNSDGIGNGKYYLNQARLVKYGYEFSDAADANNVYLWLKMKNNTELYSELIDKSIMDIKNMTSKPVYMKSLIVNFAICASNENTARNNIEMNTPSANSYIEVTLNNNVIYTTSSIKSQISNIIQKYFNENNLTLGDIIDSNEILEDIYLINGIERIRTIWKEDDNNVIIRNGLSFVSWTTDLIDIGDDVEVTTSSKALLDFLFPLLYNPKDIINKITVISKSVNNINIVLY